MKRLISALALTSFVMFAHADDPAQIVPPASAQTTTQGIVTQYNAAPRSAFEVPAERIKPLNDRRPRQPRGADWQRKQAEMEREVRSAIGSNGFNDVALQDAILAHIKNESKARMPLRERGRRLYRGLNSPKVGDAEMSLALGAYMTALEADRARRTLAEEDLDAKIGWKKNPRLHSMLLLFGVIGESPITLSPRNFNQPPRAMPRSNDASIREEAPQQVVKAPAAGETPVTIVPLDDPPTTDAITEDTEDEN